MHIPFFRIFYSTTFTVFALILILLLLVTPGDQIYQAFKNRQIYNIFIVAGAYLLTLLAAVVLYASRLYTNRTVLAAIPKAWSPTEKGDVAKRVRRLVMEHLDRSALITYESRPRDLRGEKVSAASRGIFPNVRRCPSSRISDGTAIPIPHAPTWGTISHPGWSSPSSLDLPNLQYEPVIIELPHLIEAKAVLLAPPDPLYDLDSNTSDLEPPEPPTPDAAAVELLQRPATMGLRDYISHLTSLDVIAPPFLAISFLALYEKARFSGEELDEGEFRTLMNIFAEILRSMDHLDSTVLADLHDDSESASEFFGDGAAPDAASLSSTNTVAYTPRPSTYITATNSSGESRSGSPQTTRTAPSFQRSGRRNLSSTASGSGRQGMPTPSMASVRPVRSVESVTSQASQRSGGSVIRLAEARGPLDLPYTITTGSEGAF